MQELLLSEERFKKETKTCTIRNGVRSITPGQLILRCAATDKTKVVFVTEVSVEMLCYVPHHKITDSGYFNGVDFALAMQEIYPDISHLSPVTVITYTSIEKAGKLGYI